MRHIKVTKHLVIVAVCAAAMFVAGGLVHREYSQHVAQEQAKQAAQDAKAEQAVQQRAALTTQVNNDIRHECDKETAYWNLLTPLQRKGKEVPACRNFITVNP